MTEYKLVVKDTSNPESRLAFIKRFERFLTEAKQANIIEEFTLSFSCYDKIIFSVKADG